MNVMAWIAIAAIIIPNAIKAYELYLAHKKQAAPKPVDDQPKADSQDRKARLEREIARLWWAGVVTSIIGILVSGTWFVWNLIIPYPHRRLLIFFAALHAFSIYNNIRVLRTLLKEK